MLAAGTATAQTRIAEYRSDYYDRDYYVEVGTIDEDGDYIYYIQVNSHDPVVSDINLALYQFTAAELLESLSQARAKYDEWRQVAAVHDVRSVDKKIDVEFPEVRAGFMYDGWEFSPTTLTPRFRVEEGRCMLVLQGESLTSGDYTAAPYDIVFRTDGDFDSFARALAPEVAEAHFGNYFKTERLRPAHSGEEAYRTVGKYSSGYFGRSFYVKAAPGSGRGPVFRIETASDDRYVPETAIGCDASVRDSLRSALDAARGYWTRWSAVAAANNITDLDRPVPVDFPRFTGRFRINDEWYGDEGRTTVAPRFRVMDGRCLLILTGSTIVTDYVDCDGFFIVFGSDADLDSFLDALDAGTASSPDDRRIDELFR